jgi:hypothetical protein
VASRIEQIEAVINALIGRARGEAVEGGTNAYAEVLDVEVPPQAFPASTLLFSYPAQRHEAMGGGLTENEWRFIQRSYFDYTDPALAQREMKSLLPALLSEVRNAAPEDLELPDGTSLMLDVEDAGDPDRAAVGETQMLVKSLYLIARTEEN